MHRPVRLSRIFGLLVLLVVAGCRSSGDGRPVEHAAGPSATDLHGGWVWTAPAPAWTGMPAADDREVAVTFGHQQLVVLDGEGRERWRAPRLGLRDVAPRLTADVVLAATDDGVAAFRRADGSLVWDVPLGQRANTPVVVGRLAVTSTWEGNLVALDAGDGRVVWKAALPGPSIGPPATDGTAVAVTWDRVDRRSGGAMAVEGSTGRTRWAVPLPGGGVSAPTVTGDRSVVMVAGDLAAHGLALATGERRWRTPLEGAGSPEVPPATVDPGSVLVAHRLGGLDLLDSATGRRLWQVGTDGAAVRGGPVVGPAGSFAFPLDDGRLVLAGPNRSFETRQAPGRISGLAAGPRGLLIGAIRGAAVNTVEATPDW